jgi:hypothetical protein
MAALVAVIGVPGAAPVSAQSQSGGIITFESGVDRAVIGSTIPGVTFSNTAGSPWLYGDVRTGLYNAPYPSNCPGFGGPCAYTVDGNFFAWMGAVSGIGRIDFTSGPVGFVSAAFSTADPLTVEAYDSANTLVASQSVAANLRTGRLDVVELSGSGITYVLIKGGQNRWLLDDLTLAAAPPTTTTNANPAEVTVVQRVTSPATISPGSSITLTVVATNRGRGIAKNATITLPVDPAQLRLDNATFSRTGAWVSAISAGTVTIQTGGLAPGASVTATLTISVIETAVVGGSIGGPLTFRWSDAASGGSGSSNNLGLTVGGPAFAPALTVGGEVGKPTFSSAIFAPGEPVGVWYNTPDGKAVALQTIRADAKGAIAFSLDTGGLPAGAYSVVAYGHWTEFTAVAPFSRP